MSKAEDTVAALLAWGERLHRLEEARIPTLAKWETLTDYEKRGYVGARLILKIGVEVVAAGLRDKMPPKGTC